MKCYATCLAAALLVASIAGCNIPGATSADPLQAARQAQAWGLEGELTVIYGAGHIGGASYNLTGSSGVLRLSIRPDANAALPPSEPGE